MGGFTLVELFVSLAIIGIISAFVVPTFVDFIRTYRVDGNLRTFSSAIKYTQSEAARRGLPITMCVDNPSTAAIDCNATASADWDQGWQIFLDRNGNGVVDLDPDPVLSDLQIKQQGAIEDLNFYSAPDTNVLTFLGTGALQTGANISFLICNIDPGNADCGDTDSYTSELRTFASGAVVFVSSK